jgi:hypothetical protein
MVMKYNDLNGDYMTEKSQEEKHKDGYTIVRAYSENHSYDDIVAGKKDVEDFAAKGATCDKCELTARNDRELKDHLSHAHNQTDTSLDSR